MIREWEEFTQKNVGNVDLVRVSLNQKGVFGMNQKAIDVLGGPKAVVFMFDKANRLIGLKGSAPDVDHAYELKRQGASQSYYLRAKSFCNFYGIEIGETIVFNDVEVDDGVIVLKLDNVTEATRRTRSVEFPEEFYDEPRRVEPSKFSTLLRMKMPGEE